MGGRTKIGTAWGVAWVALCTTYLCGAAALATTPSTVALQGSLRGADGGPVADGKYLVTFRLYNAINAKQALHTEVVDPLLVQSGRFRYALGGSIKLQDKVLATAAWIGVQVANEPENQRAPLRSAPFVLRARRASSLSCTNCLSVNALLINGDLALGGNDAKAKLIAAGTVLAGSVSATSLVGEGSKLTGVVPAPEGCPKNHVVVGVKANGKLNCQTGGGLPDDALSVVSGGLLTTAWSDSISSQETPKAIQDNNPIGTSAVIDVPDVGLIKQISVTVKLTNSDLSGIEVRLYDAANSVHVLHKGKPGKKLDETWPITSKPVSGDLGKWAGKNPKGKWRLRIIDTKFLNNGNDGSLEAFALNVSVKATNLVTSKGVFAAAGGFGVQKSAGPPYACMAKALGGQYFDTKTMRMYYCDGEWRELLVESLCGNGKINSTETCDDGNTKGGDGCTPKCQINVCGDGVVWLGKEQCDDGNLKDGDGCDSKCKGGVFSCAAWKVAGAAKDGEYLVDPDSIGPLPPFKAFCEMDLDGGGWTLVLNLNTVDGNKSTLQHKIWTQKTEFGSFASRWFKDYKSPAAMSVKGKAILLIVRNAKDAENANPVGWRSWNLNGEKRFQEFFDVNMGDGCANKTGGCNGGHSGEGRKQTTGIKSQGVKAKWDTFTGFAQNVYTNSYYGCCGGTQDGFRMSSWYRWANNSNVGLGLQMDNNSFGNYSLEAGSHMSIDSYNNPQRFCSNCNGCKSCPEGNCYGSNTKAAIGSDHYHMHCSVGVSYRYEWYIK